MEIMRTRYFLMRLKVFSTAKILHFRNRSILQINILATVSLTKVFFLLPEKPFSQEQKISNESSQNSLTGKKD